MRVIGVGNVLLCDEGIGVHVAKELERRSALPGVEVIDGGVAGAGLLHLIEEQDKVVVIDAAAAPLPPGTVIRLRPGELKRAEGTHHSLHDLTLADTLDLMRLRGTLPDMLILGVVPADVETCRIGLSDALAEKFGEIVEKVNAEILRFRNAPPEAGES